MFSPMVSFKKISFAILLSISAFSQETLKSAFEPMFKMGVAVNDDIISGKAPELRAIVQHHFNAITLENSMKAALINPEPSVFNFGPADDFVAFGKQHNMFIIGHTLVWHNQTPSWFFKAENGEAKSKEEVKQRLHDHIKTIASRYEGKVNAWDVVNEVIDDNGDYRPTLWVNGIGDGDELVKLAFQYAAKYSPSSELYYNDFNAWRPAKRDGIVRMVKMLQQSGIRIDGIGIQGHWGLNYPKNKYIEEAIDAYAALGLKVMITELDIDVLPLTKEGQIIGQSMGEKQFQNEEFKEFLDPYPNKLPDEVQNALAERYAELFQIFKDKKDKIDRVTFWGIHDSMSWKNDYPIPNRTNYPLLWDRNLKPKPAVNAIIDVSKN